MRPWQIETPASTVTGATEFSEVLRSEKELCWQFVSHRIFPALLVLLGYYLGSRVGFALTLPPSPISVLWPPNSILLAALLVVPRTDWPLLIVAALPAHFAAQWQSGVPAAMQICWFLSNTAEALIGACCTRCLVGNVVRLDLLRHTVVFCLCGGLMGPLFSSFLDAGFVRLNQWGEGSFWRVWWMRCSSNVLAALTITPVAMGFHNLVRIRTGLRHKLARRKAELAWLFAGLIATNLSVYVLCEAGPHADITLLYAGLPFLLWATLRFG
jgi:integral membrane sensor domain MASE1